MGTYAGCFDLRNGSMAIGVATVSLGCVLLSYFIHAIAMALYLAPNVFQLVPLYGYIYGISAAFSFLYIMFGSLLIHGIKTTRRGMVVAWITFAIVFGVLQTIGVFVYIGYVIFGSFRLPGLHTYPICLALVWTVIWWYWAAVVKQYYSKLSVSTQRSGGSDGWKSTP